MSDGSSDDIEREREWISFQAVAPYAVLRVLDGRAKHAGEALEQLNIELGPSVRADAEYVVEQAVERYDDTGTDRSEGNDEC